MNKQQKIIAGGIAFTLAVVSITTIYLPNQARQMNEERLRDPNFQRQGVQTGGSMWKNIDRKIKESQGRDEKTSEKEK